MNEQSLKLFLLSKTFIHLKILSMNIFIYNHDKDKTASNYIAHPDFCPLETMQIVGFEMHDINRHINNYENN